MFDGSTHSEIASGENTSIIVVACFSQYSRQSVVLSKQFLTDTVTVMFSVSGGFTVNELLLDHPISGLVVRSYLIPLKSLLVPSGTLTEKVIGFITPVEHILAESNLISGTSQVGSSHSGAGTVFPVPPDSSLS
jgi:hypothetical protein